MLEILSGMLAPLIQFISTIDYIRYIPETLGIFVIWFFFILILKIRKRRMKKTLRPSPGAVSMDQVSGEMDSELQIDAQEDLDVPEDELEEMETAVEKEAWIAEAPYPESSSEPVTPAGKTPSGRGAMPTPGPDIPEKKTEPISFLGRLKSGLSKTRQSLTHRFDVILSGNRKIDGEVLEAIEEVLITADIGVPTTMALMERIEKNASRISSAEDFKALLKQEMQTIVDIESRQSEPSEKPHVIMVIGVNGVGKTTTIGKLAAKFSAQGQKVLLAAADTFRAAAAEQLEIWAQRADAEIVRHRDKSDPAAVAFDSIEAAQARKMDVVIVDTAGRLHTKVNLMEELKKIKRSINKKLPAAPHETFLVLDATTGQNAVSQAKLFHENIPITGIILTKLDGTAKGGIVVSICDSLKVPIRYIGVGESVEDLQEFDPALFVNALL